MPRARPATGWRAWSSRRATAACAASCWYHVGIHRKLSLGASVASELLHDVRLPAEALLPEATSLRGPLSCLDDPLRDRAGAIGAARACFEAAIQYSKERVAFGRPVAATQIQQLKLAEMAVEVNRGTLLALHPGRLKDDGLLHPEHLSMAKLANVNAALHVAHTRAPGAGRQRDHARVPGDPPHEQPRVGHHLRGAADVHALVVGGVLTGIQPSGEGQDRASRGQAGRCGRLAIGRRRNR